MISGSRSLTPRPMQHLMRHLMQGAIVATTLFSTACDQFSPTEVRNPNVTNSAFLRTPDASRLWVKGVERTFLQTLNTLLVNTEIVSDNYFNNYTTQNKVFDQPRIDNQDLDVRSMFTDIARLRESATYGIEVILPADTIARVRNEADLLFYRAMGSIFVGEYFTGMPATALGPIVDAAGHLRLAIDDLKRARVPCTPMQHSGMPARRRWPAPTIAWAIAPTPRPKRRPCWRPPLSSCATPRSTAPRGRPTASRVDHERHQQLSAAARLDFLDPKYPNRGAQVQSPLALLKAEEAHAILAEAALATNDLTTARTRLTALLTLVQQRPRNWSTRAIRTADVPAAP